MKDREQVGGLGKPDSEEMRQIRIAKRIARGLPGPRPEYPPIDQAEAARVLEKAFPGRR